jgi:Protein of unknown function (DUF3326)
MIQNKQFTLNRSKLTSLDSLPEKIGELLPHGVLRWYVSRISGDDVVVEATLCDEAAPSFDEPVADRHYPGKGAVLSLIPTGVGCDIGGYAGDAAPATSLLAAAADYLITNPNAVNASNFIRLDDNVVYTEGYSIDLFCQGRVNLYRPYANRVGLIVEKTEAGGLDAVFNIVNTVRAIHGVEIADIVVTDRPIGGRCVENQSGAFAGTVDHPEVLFEACEKLIARGADAIAVTSNIQDLPAENYAKHFDGQYPNPVGGVEAVISHLITRRYQLPSAHAPLLNIKQLELTHSVVDARGAGEMASASGLACVLIGLRGAPQLRPRPVRRVADILNLNNLLAVVTPASCLGGVPVLATRKHNIPVIAVRDNRTVLHVTQEEARLSGVIEVQNYAEAAGLVVALKAGISLESIARPMHTLRYAADAAARPAEQKEKAYAGHLAA